ncbi:MAG: hypothetical protein JJ884_11420 [Maricaulis sp.]|uniref:hypothetical protein n=1 Tax=Maricaulis sp. TaxID=1486257 RepID=UPI001B1830E2|nr:hypothetical protein [Maricaulis sp.]MBO6728776.1 hypothetical protein [Maricaulis sp.]MBO6848117.1 hypothetical protein [Maricaulis sp.]MBO6877809.1 hypothetical protein [Maricaulis sp.]
MDVFDVLLTGADEKGRFTALYRVMSFSEDSALTLARASAALADYAVLEATIQAKDLVLPDGSIDFPRVLSHGDREYVVLN